MSSKVDTRTGTIISIFCTALAILFLVSLWLALINEGLIRPPDWTFTELKFYPSLRSLPGTLLVDSDGKWVDASGREGIDYKQRFEKLRRGGHQIPLLISASDELRSNLQLSQLLNINLAGQWCVNGVVAHVASSANTSSLLLERALNKYGVGILTPGNYALRDPIRVRSNQTLLILPGSKGVTIDDSAKDASVIWVQAVASQ
jgi:hypothetical protein